MLGLVSPRRERRRVLEPVPTPEAARSLQKRAKGLDEALRRHVEGEVRFDDGARALYASDLSMYRQVPIGVVVPKTIEDVVETVRLCREREVPILGRGTGTSLAGQGCNVAVIIDFSRHLNRLVDLDPAGRTAWVEPGLINDQLRNAAEEYHLTFAPDPATHAYCTLGGMIGNNACGTHSMMGGRTSDNIHELDILTWDGLRMRVGQTSDEQYQRIIEGGGRRGEIYRALRGLRDRYAEEIRARYAPIPRRVSGYNLDDLLPEKGFHVARALVGSESTLVMVLGARVRLIPSPPQRALIVLGFESPSLAGDAVPYLREMHPLGMEAVHSHVIENLRRKGKPAKGAELLPEGNTWLLVEFGGDTLKEACDRAKQAKVFLDVRGVGQTGDVLVEDPKKQDLVWKIRESGVGASRVPGEEEAWPSWEDSAVAPEKLGDYLRRITFDTRTRDGVKQYRAFMEEAANLVTSFGGSLSGEHGDGQARGELLSRQFGPAIVQAFREYKSIWDPHWRMNPGKLVDPFPLDTNLRVGPDYHPAAPATHFKFPDDHGSLARATERCFGVGKCRRIEGGTMCPSFMVTREEQHTTRGRARLLFEMLRGDALHDGWKDEHVKDALDLCLMCKGCKGDCPESVDIATWKAEFLSHYYEGRRRPPAAYAMGLVQTWARLARIAPWLANFLAQTDSLSKPARRRLGISQKRPLPRFARESFQEWFAKHEVKNPDGPSVILWPDTFHNHFHPETAQHAVEVLEAAGWRVEVPAESVCCGRPLYDYGMLDRAEKYLKDTLALLRPHLRAGVPVVVLEPSCASVFRDELRSLMPTDDDAVRLGQQTKLLSELLVEAHWTPPKLRRKALLHGHCHHKSILGMDAENELLEQMGLSVEEPESGCCGLAGSFGYEADKYELSMQIGERALLPKVREASEDTLIVTDGFSCRSQVEHASTRTPLHLADVLAMALHERPEGPAGVKPEEGDEGEPAGGRLKLAMGAAGALALATGGWWAARRNSR